MASTAERVCAQCEHQIAVQGYIRFSDIAKAENISRQRVDAALLQAVSNGLISDDQRMLWRHSYRLSVVPTKVSITHSNLEWLRQQAEDLDLSMHDVLNRALHQHIHTHQNHASFTKRQS